LRWRNRSPNLNILAGRKCVGNPGNTPFYSLTSPPLAESSPFTLEIYAGKLLTAGGEFSKSRGGQKDGSARSFRLGNNFFASTNAIPRLRLSPHRHRSAVEGHRALALYNRSLAHPQRRDRVKSQIRNEAFTMKTSGSDPAHKYCKSVYSFLLGFKYPNRTNFL
jgi:hypothetical protein